LARDDLAADTVGRFIDCDTTQIAQLLLQIPGAHQPAGAAANDCKIQHFLSVASAAPARGASGPSRLSKSAFHPERKMNKAGSCTAAMKESSKKAGARPALFLQHRNFADAYSAGGSASGSASGADGTIVACFSRSSRISL